MCRFVGSGALFCFIIITSPIGSFQKLFVTLQNQVSLTRRKRCKLRLIPRYKGDVPNPKGGVRGVIPSKQSYVAKPERKWMTNDDTPYANGYLKWEKEADDLLCHMFDEGTTLQVIAVELGRSEVAIKRRLRRWGKI